MTSALGLEEDPRGDKDDKDEEKSDSETEHSEEDVEMFDENLQPIETSYVESVPEELGQVGGGRRGGWEKERVGGTSVKGGVVREECERGSWKGRV